MLEEGEEVNYAEVLDDYILVIYTNDPSLAGEHDLSIIYTLDRYPSITKTKVVKVTLYDFVNPNVVHPVTYYTVESKEIIITLS